LIRAEGLLYRDQETSALGHYQQVDATKRFGDMSFQRSFEVHHAALPAHVPLEGVVARLLSRDLGRPQAEGQRRDWENPGDHTHQTASVECLHQHLPGAYRCRFTQHVKMRELVLGLRRRGGSGGLKSPVLQCWLAMTYVTLANPPRPVGRAEVQGVGRVSRKVRSARAAFRPYGKLPEPGPDRHGYGPPRSGSVPALGPEEPRGSRSRSQIRLPSAGGRSSGWPQPSHPGLPE